TERFFRRARDVAVPADSPDREHRQEVERAGAQARVLRLALRRLARAAAARPGDVVDDGLRKGRLRGEQDPEKQRSRRSQEKPPLREAPARGAALPTREPAFGSQPALGEARLTPAGGSNG